VREPWLGTVRAVIALTAASAAFGLLWLLFIGWHDRAVWFGWRYFVLTPAAVVAIIAFPIWWLVVVKTSRPGLVTGAIAGLLCFVLCRPVHFFLWMGPDAIIHPTAQEIAHLGTFSGETSGFALLFEIFLMVLSLPVGLVVGAVMGRAHRIALLTAR
jgi:hypothetical protein